MKLRWRHGETFSVSSKPALPFQTSAPSLGAVCSLSSVFPIASPRQATSLIILFVGLSVASAQTEHPRRTFSVIKSPSDVDASSLRFNRRAWRRPFRHRDFLLRRDSPSPPNVANGRTLTSGSRLRAAQHTESEPVCVVSISTILLHVRGPLSTASSLNLSRRTGPGACTLRRSHSLPTIEALDPTRHGRLPRRLRAR